MNRAFLDTALAGLPTPRESRVPCQRALNLRRDEDGTIHAEPIRQRRPLNRGDSLVLDFGNHQVGRLSLSLSCQGSHPDAPAWLRLQFAEQPVELFERAEDYHGWISTGWIQTEQLHVDLLPQLIHLPRRFAFRYVKIEVLDVSSKFSLVVEDAWCTAVTSADDSRLSPLNSKDPLLLDMDRVACRTLRNCMQRVFEDGPKRDRRLWLGDLRLQALANYRTYGQNELVKACMYLFAALPREDGLLSAAVFLEPEPEGDDTFLPDYSLLFTRCLLDYWQHSGDRQTLKELWPTALKQLELGHGMLENGIFPDRREMGWCFIDWTLELNKQCAMTGVYLYALRAGIRLAELLGQAETAALLRQRWEDCAAAARARLYDPELGLWVSGSDRQISLASQIWMILGGLVPPTEGPALLERVKALPGAVPIVTPYLYHYCLEALELCGREDLVLKVLREYWGGMVLQGADTFWELYNPANPAESPYGGTIVNSYCHAWSCAPAWFLRKERGSHEA